MGTIAVIVSIITFILILILLITVGVSLIQFRKIQVNKGEVPLILQGLTQVIQQQQMQVAGLAEKLTHIEPVTQTVSNLQVDVRGLGERIVTVENNQSLVNQGVGNLTASALSTFAELKTLTSGLSEATDAMRLEISQAQTNLTELRTHAKVEQENELRITESIRRLETIIAGTHSKGSAGENVLELVFSKLPVEWQVRDFKVGGKLVEFGLRLPNSLIMPIDSKWAATNLLEQFVNTEDIQDQLRLKRAIEEAVLQKAKEVRKYIDPNITVNFGVAVIPDAIYDLCSGVQAEVFQQNVVLISYSMFIPYLLLVFQTILKTCQSIDISKLETYLQTTEHDIKSLQDELDGRFSRAITMLNNSRDDMRAHVSRISGSLTGLYSGANAALPALPEAALPELIQEQA